MKTFPNSTVNDLPELTFIAGTYKELYFHTYTSACTVIDFTSGCIIWDLRSYDYPEHVAVSKDAIGTSTGFTVKLLSTDTLLLRGKYIQQPRISGSDVGYDYRLARGVVNIIPAGGES